MKFEVRIYGLAKAQGRPRAFALPTGHIRMYDPPDSKDWKRTVMAQALPARPAQLLVGPLVAEFTFFLPRPKSAPKRVVRPVTKPDLSNLLKGVEDALRGIVYADDSQLVDLRVSKTFADAACLPGIHILIEELA